MKRKDRKERIRKDRPMTTVTLRMPQDVIDDLKRIMRIDADNSLVPQFAVIGVAP